MSWYWKAKRVCLNLLREAPSSLQWKWWVMGPAAAINIACSRHNGAPPCCVLVRTVLLAMVLTRDQRI